MRIPEEYISEEAYLSAKLKIKEEMDELLFSSEKKIFASSLIEGYDFMEAKMWDKAIKKFERAIEKWPHDDESLRELYPKTVSVLGGCYENSGEIDKAIEVLEKLVSRGGAIALTHYNLGWAYDEKGRSTGDKNWFYRAAQEQEKAIELNSDYYDAYYNLACAYAMLGEKEKAFFAVERAKEKGFNLLEELVLDPDFKKILGI